MAALTITTPVEHLEAVDPMALDEGAARAALRSLARVDNWAAAVRADVVRRLDGLMSGGEGGGGGSGSGGGDSGDGGDGEGSPGGGGGGGEGSPGGGGGLPGEGTPKPTELELAEAGRISDREAARQVALARLLGRFPEFAAALLRSVVAQSHLAVLSRLWQQMELEDRHRLMELDTRLVELATVHDPERFRRLVAAEVNRRRERDGVDRLSKQRRSTSLTHWVDDAGMVNLRARDDPERGQQLRTRVPRHR